MNKKLLICGAIATGLLLTACVKKEPPKEEEQEEVETTTQQQPEQPAEFKPLDSAEPEQEIPETVEVERTETSNTTTEVSRRASQPAQSGTSDVEQQPHARVEPPATPKKEEPKPAIAKPKPVTEQENTTAQSTSKPNKAVNNGDDQSEDDAVAAAIAAATPALKN